MNPVLVKIFSFFTSVIVPIIIGYILRSLFKVQKEKLNFLIYINIYIVVPISLVIVFWDMKLESSLILLPILGFLLPLLSGYIGKLFCKNKYDNQQQKGSYIISSMLTNGRTMGGLTMYILYGEIGYAYLNLAILFVTINVYLISFSIGRHYSNQSSGSKPTIKSIVFTKTNLPILGFIIGIVLNIFGGTRPAFMENSIDPIIKTVAWLSLIPVGATIDFHGVKKQLLKVLDIGIIKFIIMPAIAALMAYILLPSKEMQTALIILNTMPVAINAVIVSKLTKLDENVSIASFLYTTIVYLLIVFPILALIFK